MLRLQIIVVKAKAKLKKAIEFYRMYKLWCIEFDKFADLKMKEFRKV